MADEVASAHQLQDVVADDADVLEDYGQEDDKKSKQVYLVTFPHPRMEMSSCGVRLKAPGDFTRQMIQDCTEHSR